MKINIEKEKTFMIIGLLLFSLFIGLKLDNVEADGEFFGGGSGTEKDPYLITNIWELQNISNNLSAHYILKNDINATKTKTWNSGLGFIPIGNWYEFITGSFNGNNHTINGLFINRSSEYNIGLFGKTSTGCFIRNVNLVNCDIFGYYNVGGLVGYNSGLVSNCSVSGSVDGYFSIGGLVGRNYLGRISNCSASGNITGSSRKDSHVGGLMGTNEAGLLENCRFKGNIKGYNYTGGLAGRNIGTGIISYCSAMGKVEGSEKIGGIVGHNEGIISNCWTNLSINGTHFIGGIVGHNKGDSVKNCYSKGDTNGDTQVGGLVGINIGGKIFNCTSTGTVIGTDVIGGLIGYNLNGMINACSRIGNVNGNIDVGGLVGSNKDTILNCYAIGNVNGNLNVGGLIGYNGGSISKCFAERNVSGLQNVGGLVGSGNIGLNSHYNIDTVLINGGKNVTIGGLFNNQFNNWFNSDYSLKISDYKSTLVPSGDYYEIRTVQGLRDLLGFAHHGGYKFRLVGDINLSNDSGMYIPYFGGEEFDGDNHTVSNLNINLLNDNLGMFGYNRNGKIKNIGLIDCLVKGKTSVGGLVGGNLGTVHNCYSKGIIQGYISVGGLIGVNDKSPVSDCFSTAEVNGSDMYIGGLIGYNTGEVNSCYATGNVSRGYRMGGLIGENYGTLSNCYATGNVNGGRMIGGLTGECYSSVSNCYATGNVYGTIWVGGLLSTIGYSTISDCYSTGNVSGDRYVGGLIGIVGLSTVIDCYASGEVYGVNIEFNSSHIIGGLVGWSINNSIFNCYAIGNVSGDGNIAGLIGYNEDGIISNCHAIGSVSGTNSYHGGLVGNNDDGLVEKCYATGNVNGKNCVGGLIGYHGYTEGIVDNSYATGDVTGSDQVGGLIGFDGEGAVYNCYSVGRVSGISNVGGLVGRRNWGEVLNSYWDYNTSGRSLSAGGILKSTKQMKTQNSFTEWDFDNLWCMIENVTYPFFKRQDTEAPNANAGFNQAVNLDEDGKVKVKFDGSRSYDDVAILYTWSFDYNGLKIQIHGETVDFIFNIPGMYNITLNVTDAIGNSDIDNMTIIIKDILPPVVIAGQDKEIIEGDTVVFNADGCSDNVEIINYTWTFTDEVAIILYGINPTYKFITPGVFEVTLKVTDSSGNWKTDSINVTVIDITLPIANAGFNLTVNEDTSVTFNGSGSSDNVGVVNWTWLLKNNLLNKFLYGKIVNYTFDDPGVYYVILNVSDAAGNWMNDTIKVTVNDITPPTADAGIDRTIYEGEIASFLGTESSDNVGIVNWTWTISDESGNITKYGMAVNHSFMVPGIFTITLKVFDEAGNSNTDTLIVNVQDITPPVANAGYDIIIQEGTIVNFNGNLSSDNVGIVNFTWTFFDGFIEMTLYGIAPNYTFNHPGVFYITLFVTDAAGFWHEDFLMIQVNKSQESNMSTIQGKVTDEDGNPLEGVQVKIKASDGKQYITTTDANGSFSMEIPDGNFSWKINRKGYKPVSGTSSTDELEEGYLDFKGVNFVEEDNISIGLIAIIMLSMLFFIAISISLFVILRKKRLISEKATPKKVEDGVIPKKARENEFLELERLYGPQPSEKQGGKNVENLKDVTKDI